MYFCPCSCDDPTDLETEENELFSLPRNLSYVQDSYLDRYSVSASFVHNPKIERCIQHQQGQEWRVTVEDETLGLLSTITAHELHGRCDGGFDSVNSSGFVFPHQDTVKGSVISHQDIPSGSVFSRQLTATGSLFSHQDTATGPVYSDSDIATGSVFSQPETSTESVFSKASSNPITTWPVTHSSAFRASTFLHPASLVASKISAFLHSPPNETMDLARDLGTSVDGDNLPLPLQTDNLANMDLSIVGCPDSSVNDMVTCDSVQCYSNNNSANSDVEGLDGLVAQDSKSISSICVAVTSDVATAEDTITPNPLVIESKDHSEAVIADIVYNPIEFESKDYSEEATTEDTVAYNPLVVDSKVKYPHTNIFQNIFQKIETGETTYLRTFCEESEKSTRKDLDVGNNTEANVGIDREDSHRVADIANRSSTYKTSHYPAVRSLDVEIKTYSPERDIAVKMAKEDAGRVIKGTVSVTSYGSPDSDAFIEEGVFVNIDDLDSTNEKSTTVSDTSDDTCVSVDSMFLSPEEGELEEEGDLEPNRKMTLEEAISRAATDLTKISQELYGSCLASAVKSITSSTSSLLDVDDDLGFSTLTMKTAGRTSPVRGSKGLKLKISDQTGTETEHQIRVSPATLSESPIYTEQEFNFSRVQLRKSSSLKSNKTPPGTPHRKKVVRFADAMGLDLESVRHVLNMESPPKIPPSALADLAKGLDDEVKEVGSRYLCPCFNQPGAADNFFQKIRNQKVSLENAIINGLTITGFVRVANISYHKSVRIRYTHNAWSSFYDIAASYVLNSCDGPTDRFSFSIVAPPFFGPGSRLEFAVCFIAEGVEYWDSNDGKNYVFECFAKSIPTDSETAWLHFL